MFYDKYLDFDDIEELYDNYDVNVLNIASSLENAMEYKGQIAKEGK